MDITVTFQSGRWITDPNPAIVEVGTKVRWIVRAPDEATRALVWRVSFVGRPPFGEDQATLEIMTQRPDREQPLSSDLEVLRQLNLDDEALLDHRGATAARAADRPGEYKYDLTVQDARTGELIGYDDPWLIVVRGIFRPFDYLAF